MKTNQLTRQEIDLEELVKELKSEDTRNQRLTHTFKWFMWVLSPVYLLIFLIGIVVDRPELDKFGILFFSLGFLLFGLLYNRLNKEYRTIDYGVSTLEMLRKAVSRYAFWQTKTYLVILPVLLFVLGFSFSMQKELPFENQTVRFLAALGTILFIFGCAILFGYYYWRKRQKPLRDKALAILREVGE